MVKLRRTARNSISIPVAADVLEVRSLLSAGVHAAVATAVHHANHDVQPAAAAKPINLSGSLFANYITCPELGITGFHVNGQFQSLSVVPTVGGKLHATWTQTVHYTTSVFSITSIKGNISSHVTSIDTSTPGETIYHYAPLGSITIKGTFGGQKFTAKLTPEPADLTALYVKSSNIFYSLDEDFRLPNNGTTHGGLVYFILDPPP